MGVFKSETKNLTDVVFSRIKIKQKCLPDPLYECEGENWKTNPSYERMEDDVRFPCSLRSAMDGNVSRHFFVTSEVFLKCCRVKSASRK